MQYCSYLGFQVENKSSSTSEFEKKIVQINMERVGICYQQSRQIRPETEKASTIDIVFCTLMPNPSDSSEPISNVFNIRSIFQTFWKQDCCTIFIFFYLKTSSFDYLFIFWFPLPVQSFSNIDIRHFIMVPPLNFW